MSTDIRYLKSKPVGKVTFRLPKAAAPEAKTVNLVGEFNAWNEQATPMKKLKNGSFSAVLDLEVGRTYRFRYLIDDKTWENDWDAQAYESTPFAGVENSVVTV